MGISEIIIGVLFFGFALHAHSHFTEQRMRREEHNQNDAENCSTIYY